MNTELQCVKGHLMNVQPCKPKVNKPSGYLLSTLEVHDLSNPLPDANRTIFKLHLDLCDFSGLVQQE